MLISTTSRRRLGALAAACLLSVALPAAPVWAQKTKTKDAPAAETSAPPVSEFAVDIPTIEAVDSNVDEDTLRDIFSGNVVANADALAGLTATSVSIPEITVTAETTIEGKTTDGGFTFNDLVLSDISNGVAASVSVGGMTFSGGDFGSGEYGSMSAANFDIGGVLGMYGLVDGSGQTELKTIYTDFAFEGGSLTAPDISCTFGSITAAEFKARPLKHSFAEIMALAEAMDETDGDPSPETIASGLRMYVDILTAFESSPIEFGGFDCSGTDEEDRAIQFKIAAMSIGAMSPGYYPAVALEGLDVAVEGDGTVALGSANFKGMDLTGPIAAIEGAPEAIDEAWFAANARALIPAFEGFAFSNLAIDVPDPEADDGARIKANVGAFDLTLGKYLNGIPTDLLTSASNIIVDLPTDSDDEQVKQLLALGISTIDAGFVVDASWNEAENVINVDDISISGVDLATIKLAGTIANATEALFSVDEFEAMGAAMGVAIANLKVDVNDAGLSDIIMARVAADQGGDPAAMRPIFAGLAEGTIVGMLAGAAEAQKVGAAINSFVSGNAKHLTIDLTAKEAPGLGMMDFMAAEDDPTVLIGKVTIDATAK